MKFFTEGFFLPSQNKFCYPPDSTPKPHGLRTKIYPALTPMKLSLKFAPLLAVLLWPGVTKAANFTWDTTPGDGAATTPGSGTWDLGATNQVWNNGTTNVAWANNNTAIFAGPDAAAGTYVVSPVAATALVAAGITFNNSGYTLNSAAATSVTTTGAVTVAAGKSATIGNNVTLGRAATFTVTGGGLLTLNGKINGNTGPSEITGGSTLDVQPGGAYTINTSIVVGAFNAGPNLNGTLNVNGGAVSMTATTGNFVLGNIITAGSNTTSVVNMNSGTLGVNSSSPFGIRFGNGNQNNGTVTGTFNLNGGTVTTPSVGRGTITSPGVVNATFNFNGGTLVPNKTNATFLQNITAANVQAGGAVIDTGAFDITIGQNLLDGGGGGGLQKLGAAALTLTGDNTYTGTTTIATGTLNVGAGGTTGSLGNGVIVNNGALRINRSDAVSLPNVISGTGTVTLAGAGKITLGGANTYTGATTVSAGRLELAGSLTSDVNLATGSNIGGEGSTTGTITFPGTHQLFFDPTTGGSLQADKVVTTGATVTLVATIPAAGTGIVVLEAPGGITGSISNFVFNGRGTPYLDGTNTKLLVDFAPVTLAWKGQDATNPTYWDTTTTNWMNGAAADKFLGGDAVNFTDAASTFTVAVQPGGVTPGVMTFTNDANDYTLTGDAVQGLAALVKNGTRTLIVANNNTYSGGTTINTGTLQLGDGTAATGSLGTALVVNNAALTTNFGVNNASVSSVITGSGTLTQNGTGVVALTGANTYSGTTTISSGTLQVGDAGTTGTLGSGAVVNNATLAIKRSDATTISNAISGSGAVTNTGAGITTLSGANSYDGTTTVAAGILLVTSPTGLGSTVGGTTVAANTELRIQGGITVTGETLTLNGGGTGTGTGALRSISGNNVWAGDIISVPVTGITRIASDNDLLTVSGNIALSAVATDQFVLQGFGTMEITGVISGASRITCSSNGGPTSTRILSGANTYTGQTLINGGTLSVSSINSVNGGTPPMAASSLGAPITVAAGTINLTGTNLPGTLRYTGAGETTDRIINMAGTTGTPILDQSGPSGMLVFSSNIQAGGAGTKTLTLTGSTAGVGAIDGIIPDNSATNKTNLAKTGTGKWILTNDNTYTGNTSIQEGTLALGSIGQISRTPSIVISPGATFDVSATAGNFFLQAAQAISGGSATTPANIEGSFVVGSNATVSPGVGNGGVGTLHVNGGLTLSADVNLVVDLGTTSDQITVTGPLELEGILAVNNPTGVTGTFPIITYTGARTGSGLVMGATTGGLYYSVSTATPGVVNLIVSATPPAGFANWQGTTWPGVTDVNIIGPQADPDNDGIQNLIEYALGLDATVSGQAGLPTMSMVTDAGTNYLAISVTRPLGSRSDLTYVGEFSDSLTTGSWGPGVAFGSVTDNGNGTETAVWRDTVANTANRRFGRLRVIQN